MKWEEEFTELNRKYEETLKIIFEKTDNVLNFLKAFNDLIKI